MRTGVTTWGNDWQEICKWFGLKGVRPRSGALTEKAWVMANKGRWEEWVKENGLKEGILEANGWISLRS